MFRELPSSSEIDAPFVSDPPPPIVSLASSRKHPQSRSEFMARISVSTPSPKITPIGLKQNKTQLAAAEKPQPKKKLGGISQVANVYAELNGVLGEEIPTAELLQAAEKLIRISKGEYVDKVASDRGSRPNYFTRPVDDAFEKHQWQVLATESQNIDLDETFEMSDAAASAFRSISAANGFMEL